MDLGVIMQGFSLFGEDFLQRLYPFSHDYSSPCLRLFDFSVTTIYIILAGKQELTTAA